MAVKTSTGKQAVELKKAEIAKQKAALIAEREKLEKLNGELRGLRSQK